MKHLPGTYTESGKVITPDETPSYSSVNAPLFPSVSTPKDVGDGGVVLGWLESWRLKNLNNATAEYARYLKTLISISQYESELRAIATNFETKVAIAGESLRFELDELRRKANRSRELEDIEIEKRAIQIALIKAQKEAQTIELTEKSMPIESRLRKITEHFNRMKWEVENDTSLSEDDKVLLASQFVSLRDAQFLSLTGQSCFIQPSKSTETKNFRSKEQKDQECALLTAECEVKCAMLKLNALADDPKMNALMKALRVACEVQCRAIHNS